MRIKSGTWQDFVSADREAGGPLTVDLSDATWADPIVAAGVVTVIEHARNLGREVQFTPPRSASTSGYLARMRLGAALDNLGVDHKLPAVNERDQTGNLLEIRPFSTEHDGEQLAGIVFDRVQESGEVAPQVLERLHEALVELATNTAIHAGVDHGFVVAQTYRTKGCLKFCVADAGIGFRASLDQNRELHPVDDAHALEMAVMRQLSGTEDRERGYGLHSVVESVRQLGGVSEIASGTASAVFTHDPASQGVTDAMYTTPLSSAYNGVIVQVTLPWEPGR